MAISVIDNIGKWKTKDVRLQLIYYEFKSIQNISGVNQTWIPREDEGQQGDMSLGIGTPPIIKETAQLLYFHTSEQPIVLKEFLLKATGRQSITWDDLLQYLE